MAEIPNECSICLGPFESMVATMCGHCFCKSCIEKLVERGPSPCPSCRTVVQPQKWIRLYLSAGPPSVPSLSSNSSSTRAAPAQPDPPRPTPARLLPPAPLAPPPEPEADPSSPSATDLLAALARLMGDGSDETENRVHAVSASGGYVIGASVELAKGFDAVDDASGGCLTAGTTGTLVEIDLSGKPLCVEAGTPPTRWWYQRPALVVAGHPAAAGTHKLKVGTLVELSAGWASFADAAKGPLKPGVRAAITEVGTGSARFHSEFKSVPVYGIAQADGTKWYYVGQALTLAGSALSAKALYGTPQIGEQVEVVSGFETLADAIKGAFAGERGYLITDDDSSKPFLTQFEFARGTPLPREYWYERSALCLANAKAAASNLGIILGSWVELAADYSDVCDANDGPLTPGDRARIIHIKSAHSFSRDPDGLYEGSPGFQVTFEQITWWYCAHALVLEGSKASAACQLMPPLRVGDKVVLARGFHHAADAAKGPMVPGGRARAITSIEPRQYTLRADENGYHVDGTSWIYTRNALCPVGSPLVAPAPIISDFTHPDHPHELEWAEGQSVSWTCDVCRRNREEEGLGGQRMRCQTCDFDCCQSCRRRATT